MGRQQTGRRILEKNLFTQSGFGSGNPRCHSGVCAGKLLASMALHEDPPGPLLQACRSNAHIGREDGPASETLAGIFPARRERLEYRPSGP